MNGYYIMQSCLGMGGELCGRCGGLDDLLSGLSGTSAGLDSVWRRNPDALQRLVVDALEFLDSLRGSVFRHFFPDMVSNFGLHLFQRDCDEYSRFAFLGHPHLDGKSGWVLLVPGKEGRTSGTRVESTEFTSIEHEHVSCLLSLVTGIHNRKLVAAVQEKTLRGS